MQAKDVLLQALESIEQTEADDGEVGYVVVVHATDDGTIAYDANVPDWIVAVLLQKAATLADGEMAPVPREDDGD
jgi:hypothetical protein